MKTLIKSMVLRTNYEGQPGGYAETEIRVEDDGAGPFFTVLQPDMEDFIVGNVPQIRLNFEEIEELYEAMKVIRAQWELAGAA